MLASEHINSILPYLSPTDSVQKAIHWMEEYKLHHLPVINDNQYLGLISESILFEAYDFSTEIQNFQLSCSDVTLNINHHVYDAIYLFNKHDISIIPVLDKKNQYVGAITIYNVIDSLSEIAAFKNIGAIIVLKIREHDYSLNEISRIIESNGAKVLSSYIQESTEKNFLDVTVKLNKKSINSILASFERHSYTILATFHRDISHDANQDKLDHFFKFLNI